jgi:hypothetical protein
MKTVEQIKYSNQLRDKIIEIIEHKCFAENRKETPTPLASVYPLLHFVEAELHEYGKTLQGTILDLEWDLNHHKEKHEREVALLESKIDELNEGLTEVRNDYQDICELAGQLALPNDREWLAGQVGRENWERFKNHIGW